MLAFLKVVLRPGAGTSSRVTGGAHMHAKRFSCVLLKPSQLFLQHFLNFLPLPQLQASFGFSFFVLTFGF